MATFALGAALPSIARYRGIEAWTGGSQGLGLHTPAVPLGIPLSFDQWLYLYTLATLVFLFVVAANLLRGRIGRAIIAIRDHPLGAQALGINVALYKAGTFGLSAMYTGVAGALGALAIQYVAPGMFSVFLSLTFLIGIAIGGVASLSGAIYGALCLQLIALAVGAMARSLQTPHVFVIYGVLVILFLYLLPTGVAGLVEKAWRAIEDRRGRASRSVP